MFHNQHYVNHDETTPVEPYVLWAAGDHDPCGDGARDCGPLWKHGRLSTHPLHLPAPQVQGFLQVQGSYQGT